MPALGATPRRRRVTRVLLKVAAVTLAVWACLGCKRGQREVVVYTSVDQPFAEPIFRDFEKRWGIEVRAVFDTEETKSTGVLNRLIAEAQRPQADVFWSGDPARPFVLAKRGLLEPYASPAAASIPAQFKSADGLWTGAAARAKILLVNTRRVAPRDMPRSIRDLANPRWNGQGAAVPRARQLARWRQWMGDPRLGLPPPRPTHLLGRRPHQRGSVRRATAGDGHV